MARETKLERELRIKAEKEFNIQMDMANYGKNLMSVLEAACEEDFRLEVMNGQFLVTDIQNPDNYVCLPYKYNSECMDVIDTLNYMTNVKVQEREESNRRYMVKQAALAKLNKEERELLGI